LSSEESSVQKKTAVVNGDNGDDEDKVSERECAENPSRA
jgi:hypothetical protein